MNLIAGRRYLFDTTVFLNILWDKPIGRQLFEQSRAATVFVAYSIITETELWRGIMGTWTEAQHVAILRPYQRYFINVTIARTAGVYYRELKHTFKLQKGSIPGLGDCLIAATAHYYDLRVVSNNRRDFHLFRNFGVEVDEYAI